MFIIPYVYVMNENEIRELVSVVARVNSNITILVIINDPVALLCSFLAKEIAFLHKI